MGMQDESIPVPGRLNEGRPKEEPADDGFPPEKDVSTPPKGSDQDPEPGSGGKEEGR